LLLKTREAQQIINTFVFMNITANSNIGQVVAESYHYANIFKEAGIDFCCNGNRSIREACDEINIDADTIVSRLNSTPEADAETKGIDFKQWPIDLLADYIEKTHHRYVRKKIDEIVPYLDKIIEVHSANHPELIKIGEHFTLSAEALTSHMQKEEMVLFPYIRGMVEARADNKPLPESHFGSIENPIAMMREEHDIEGERFRQISALSNGYTPPADACNTYRITYSMLKEFEEDLHKHIHLENNILFPKAIRFAE